MTPKSLPLVGAYSIILAICGCQTTSAPHGDYFGCQPPGTQAVLFAPGIISTGLHDDYGPAFSPDGNEVFTRIAGKPYAVIVNQVRHAGQWGAPQVASFSGRYPDGGFHFSSDGQHFYFGSRRPLDGQGEPKDGDIWVVDRTEDGWSEPANLGPPVNTEHDDYLIDVREDGTLYYSIRSGAGEGGQAFVNHLAKKTDNGYATPEKLAYPFNSKHFQLAPLFSPDGSYAVLGIEGRDDSIGQHDLYVTFRTGDDSWTEPCNLGPGVNSSTTDWLPSFSPDGKYLFFVSWRYTGEAYSETRRTYDQMMELHQSPVYGWGADIYWVDIEVIEACRSQDGDD